MSNKKNTNIYNEGNVSGKVLPQTSIKNTTKDSSKSKYDVEPLPESSRPRKDGPGGE